MKPLSPTLRDNYRYVAFRLSCKDPIRFQDLQTEVVRTVKSLFGDVGVSELGVRVVVFNGTKGLVRCHYRHVSEVQAICASISKIKNNRLCITTLGTSGTIKAATEKYLQIE